MDASTTSSIDAPRSSDSDTDSSDLKPHGAAKSFTMQYLKLLPVSVIKRRSTIELQVYEPNTRRAGQQTTDYAETLGTFDESLNAFLAKAQTANILPKLQIYYDAYIDFEDKLKQKEDEKRATSNARSPMLNKRAESQKHGLGHFGDASPIPNEGTPNPDGMNPDQNFTLSSPVSAETVTPQKRPVKGRQRKPGKKGQLSVPRPQPQSINSDGPSRSRPQRPFAASADDRNGASAPRPQAQSTGPQATSIVATGPAMGGADDRNGAIATWTQAQSTDSEDEEKRKSVDPQPAHSRLRRPAVSHDRRPRSFSTSASSYVDHCYLHVFADLSPARAALHINEKYGVITGAPKDGIVGMWKLRTSYALRAFKQIAMELSDARVPIYIGEKNARAASA